MILELEKSLSDTYWMNVNDPSFPFVAVIEHTNFEKSSTYGNTHIVYLSKYLSTRDPLYSLDDEDFYKFSIDKLKLIFPNFDPLVIKRYTIWRADYSQPIVSKNYSKLIPHYYTPLNNVYISTMAQIYPEDRGTNYAVKSGKMISNYLISKINKSS